MIKHNKSPQSFFTPLCYEINGNFNIVCVIKKINIIISFIFLGAILAAAADDIEKRQAAIDQFVYDAPVFIKNKSLLALRNLDLLKEERVKKEPNPHISGETIEFKTFVFEGLEIYGSVHDQKELSIIQITITDPRWKILKGLNVGTSVELIEKVLGKPTKIYNNIKQFCGETECVNFHTKDDKIIKVEFNYYFD